MPTRLTCQPLHKFINRHETLAEDVPDPTLDLLCDPIVFRRLFGKIDEQVTDLGRNGFFAVVKVGPKCVAGCGLTMYNTTSMSNSPQMLKKVGEFCRTAVKEGM